MILGLDPATNFGLCLVESGPVWKTNSTWVVNQGYKGLLELQGRLRDYIELHKPSLVIVEGFAIASRFRHTYVRLVSIGIAARLVCAELDLRIVEIAPMSLKKAITGDGKATKSDMIGAIENLIGVKMNSDSADACGLAIIGLRLLGLESGLNDSNLIGILRKTIIDIK